MGKRRVMLLGPALLTVLVIGPAPASPATAVPGSAGAAPGITRHVTTADASSAGPCWKMGKKKNRERCYAEFHRSLHRRDLLDDERGPLDRRRLHRDRDRDSWKRDFFRFLR
ncbi:hypothetical protein GCM10010517_58900 [Streptosporangium fragile]|uniref:Secreted protein n=1 Tax=Streptosporangium fragile TaxID=46186 RepID=A0ABP6IKU1_9ACTN